MCSRQYFEEELVSYFYHEVATPRFLMTYPPTKHIALFCNPTAQNAKALNAADIVSKHLKSKGISQSIYIDQWPAELTGITDAWIFGGDGTINYFINQYPDINLPLSCFKAGSGNDFHWMLYGDISYEEQTEKILSGRPQWIDAGMCNGKLFLNGVGIGFDGAIVKDLLGKKKVAGKTSYLITILKYLFSYREKFVNIDLRDKSFSQDSFMISIANGKRYGGGFLVAPKASLTDGLLDVNFVGKIPPLKRMRYLAVVEKGDHLELPFIQYYQKDKIVINSLHQLPAHLDGEYLEAERFEITVVPNKFVFSVYA